MSEITREKPGVKFLWSHQGLLHRVVVKAANKVLRCIPFGIKYAIAIHFKKKTAPYSLVNGKVVVQIGAPFDTLNAGRSRGMYFSKLVGKQGKALIIEPVPESVVEFKKKVVAQRLDNVIVHECGAWSEPGESHINVDLKHPATNYTDKTVDYDTERECQFEKIKIKLDTVDNIAAAHELEDVFLVSITTNWAEEEILKGMSRLIEMGVQYICLAYGKDGEDYRELMQTMGYVSFSHDDRGVTYKRANS